MKFRTSKPLNGSLPRPVAFVFSGGTSLGSVQVGMLRAVFEAGIKPDLLVGTSAGAVNAASVGQGFTASRLENLANIWSGLRTSDIFGGLGIRSVLRLLNSRSALSSADSFRALLKAHLPHSHSALAIQTAVVATDFFTGGPVILSEGDLALNVLASTAIPMIFPPLVPWMFQRTISPREAGSFGLDLKVRALSSQNFQSRDLASMEIHTFTMIPCTLPWK